MFGTKNKKYESNKLDIEQVPLVGANPIVDHILGKFYNIIDGCSKINNTKLGINKALMIALSGLLINSQSVSAVERVINLSIGKNTSYSSITGFQFCSSDQNDIFKLDQWQCTNHGIKITDDPCKEDPNFNYINYELLVDNFPDNSGKYFSARIMYGDTPDILGPIGKIPVDNFNGYDYRFDWNKDNVKDYLKLVGRDLYIKDSKEIGCIGSNSSVTAYDNIITNYSSNGGILVQSYNLDDNGLDDGFPELITYNQDYKTCEIDNSNNNYGQIDKTVYDCELNSSDLIIGNKDTGNFWVGNSRSDLSGYNFLPLPSMLGQQVVKVKNGIYNDNYLGYQDNVTIKEEIDGKMETIVIGLLDLNKVNDDFRGITPLASIKVTPGCKLIDLGSIKGNSKGSSILYNIGGGTHTIYTLNSAGDGLDEDTIELPAGLDIIPGNFSLNEKRGFVGYNIYSGKTILIKLSADLKTFIKIEFNWNKGLKLIPTDPGGNRIDSLLSYDGTGRVYINKLKLNLSETLNVDTQVNPFYSFYVATWKPGFKNILSVRMEDGRDGILIVSGTADGIVNKTMRSRTFFFVPNNSGIGYNDIDNTTNYMWKFGSEYAIGETAGESGPEFITQYTPSTGQLFNIKPVVSNGKLQNFYILPPISLRPGSNTIVNGEFN